MRAAMVFMAVVAVGVLAGCAARTGVTRKDPLAPFDKAASGWAVWRAMFGDDPPETAQRGDAANAAGAI